MSELLAYRATANAKDHIDLSLLLSLEAVHTSPTIEARAALAAGLLNNARLRKILYSKEPADALAFTQTGALAASFRDHITIWSTLDTPSTARIPSRLAAESAVSLAADGNTLAKSNNDGTVSLFDLANHRQTGLLIGGPPNALGSLSFNHDGTFLAAASGLAFPENLILWNLQHPAQPVSLPVLNDPVGCSRASSPSDAVAVLSPDGRFMAQRTCYALAVASFTDKRLLYELHDTRPRIFEAIAFSPDGNTLASAGDDGVVTLRDAATGTVRRVLSQTGQSPIDSLVFSPDGFTLVAGNSAGTVAFWNIVQNSPATELTGPAGSVLGLAISRDGHAVAAAGSADTRIFIWDLSRSQQLADTVPIDYKATVLSPGAQNLAVSADGDTGMLINGDTSVSLFDTHTYKSVGEVSVGQKWVGSVAFSPDGTFFALGLQLEKDHGEVDVYDAASHRRVATMATSSAVADLGFVAEGKALVVREFSGESFWWDLQTFHRITSEAGGACSILANPKQWIVAEEIATTGKCGAESSTLVLMDLRTRAKSTLGPKLAVPAFSADGRRIAAIGPNLVATVWDVATVRPVDTFPLSGISNIYQLKLNSNGSTMAVVDGSLSGWAITLWDIARHQIFCSLTERNYQPLDIAFSPQDERLMVGYEPDYLIEPASTKALVMVWRIDLGSWRTLACAIANRNLSQPEWAGLGGNEGAYRLTCPSVPAALGAG
jgi:WD40 repeat protein